MAVSWRSRQCCDFDGAADAFARKPATVAVRAAANLSLSGSYNTFVSSQNRHASTPTFFNHEAIFTNFATHEQLASCSLRRFFNLPNSALWSGSNSRFAFDKSEQIADIARVNSTESVETRAMPIPMLISNTGNSQPNFDSTPSDLLSAHLGIDKVKLAFPIAVSTANRLLASSGTTVDGVSRSLYQHGYERIRHNADQLWKGTISIQREHGPVGFVEFNPSRWVDPTGWTAAPLLDVHSVIGLAWESVSTVFEPVIDLPDAEVRRLDIARDFVGVEHPNHYLMRLDTNARAIRTLQRTHFVSGKNGGWTLQLTNGSGKHIRMYDKHRQTQGRAPEGSIRFEVELHGWLRNHGSNIRTVSDITPSAVCRAARYWWHESRFGTPLASADDMYARIHEVLDGKRNSASLATAVYGYLRRKQEGDETIDLSSDTRRHYEQTLRQAEAFLLRDDSSPSTRALDLDAGTEVSGDE